MSPCWFLFLRALVVRVVESNKGQNHIRNFLSMCKSHGGSFHVDVANHKTRISAIGDHPLSGDGIFPKQVLPSAPMWFCRTEMVDGTGGSVSSGTATRRHTSSQGIITSLLFTWRIVECFLYLALQLAISETPSILLILFIHSKVFTCLQGSSKKKSFAMRGSRSP